MTLPKFLHSGMAGAPTNTNAAGSITGILDACLVNGFNIRAAATAVCASGVTTLTFATNHGYEDKVILKIASTAPLVAGERSCTVLGATSISIPTPGQADGSVGGVVEARVAPLGWATAFTGTNIRVYRSPNLQGSRMFYRWQDTSTEGNSVRLRGYENMTTVNAGTGLFPTTTQVPLDTAPLYKAQSATPEIWALVGDDRTVYFGIDFFTQNLTYLTAFGDIQSYRAVDAYAAFITPNFTSTVLTNSTTPGIFMPRSHTQTGNAVDNRMYGPFSVGSGSNPHPNPVSGGATFMGPVHLGIAVQGVRGRFRGLTHVSEKVPVVNGFAIVDTTIDTPARLVVLQDGDGRAAFPLDTPW